MKPDTIRRLDRRLGVPLCWALTQVARLGRIVRARRTPGPIRNILFVKLVEQGSTVLAEQAFDHAARLVGRQNLYFLVFERNRPILSLMDALPEENIIALRDDSFGHFVSDCLRGLRRLRQVKIDAAVDLEGFSRASAILAYLSGARRRVGYHRFRSEAPYRGDLMTHAVMYNFYQHVSAQFLSLVKALEAPAGQVPMLKAAMPEAADPPRPFVPEPREEAAMEDLLRRLAGHEVGRPIVILNPNASDLMPLRRWPDERFVELGRHLLADRCGLTVVITGAPDEREAAAAIADAIRAGRPDDGRVLCLAGETTLRSLLVLYGLADVLVTNDSGPAHFAALTDIEIVSMFGPETPALYRPLSRRAHCLSAGLACSPCVSVLNHRDSPCRDNACLKAITVAGVRTRVNEILSWRCGGTGRPAGYDPPGHTREEARTTA